MEKHKLDQLFSDKLSDFEELPSANAWEQLDEELNKSKKRPYGMWLSIAASAALAIVSSWYLLTGSISESELSYTYSDASSTEAELPTQIVYVPIYIQYPTADQQLIAKEVPTPQQKAEPFQKVALESKSNALMVSNPLEKSSEREDIIMPEVLDIEEVPLVTEIEETLMAYVDPVMQDEPAQEQLPLTIIYKQGEPAKESNFTKAINYMEDVRLGEKKLVNFEKLRDNIKSKFKSNKDVNTK